MKASSLIGKYVAISGISLFILFSSVLSFAAEIDVPSGDVTRLISAINKANSTPGHDTIILGGAQVIAPIGESNTEGLLSSIKGGTFNIVAPNNSVNGNTAFPVITTSITIQAHNAIFLRAFFCSPTKIVEDNQFRFFIVSSTGNFTVEDATFSKGCMSKVGGGEQAGGAIRNMGGSLTVINSKFEANRSEGNGGAIANELNGTITIEKVTFTSNYTTNTSGAIYNPNGILTVRNSQFSDNNATSSGGAIFNKGTLEVENSSFLRNETNSQGGAISNSAGGIATIKNSTFSRNTASEGGAISIDSNSPTEISYSTITLNSADRGGGISGKSTTTIKHSIITRNVAENCFKQGNWTTIEPNLTDDESCLGFTYNEDAKLDAVGKNGGPTETHALREASAAVDSVPTEDCTVTTDQRGSSRPKGNGCDLGAFESEFTAEPDPEPITPPDAATLDSFDTNGNCILDDSEFLLINELWNSQQISDEFFYLAFDAWIEETEICTISNVATQQEDVPHHAYSMGNENLVFALDGATSLNVEIFALDGHRIFKARSSNGRLAWSMRNALGTSVANGVYLVNLVSVSSSGVVNHTLEKIVVLR
jgi:predicted outer membrane repeat protein